jgi:hypothetical protein
MMMGEVCEGMFLVVRELHSWAAVERAAFAEGGLAVAELRFVYTLRPPAAQSTLSRRQAAMEVEPRLHVICGPSSIY